MAEVAGLVLPEGRAGLGPVGQRQRCLDRAFAVLSVLAEGGRRPWIEFPQEASFAALVSGIGAFEAPLPLPDWAEPGSTLRQDQAADLRHSLAWAAEALGLPPPG